MSQGVDKVTTLEDLVEVTYLSEAVVDVGRVQLIGLNVDVSLSHLLDLFSNLAP